MALGTLSIDLEARLGRMEESLAKAERSAAKSSATIAKSLGSIGDVGTRLGSIFAGLAGAVGVGAIVSQVRAVVDGLDALNDAADATGASVEQLSALEDLGRRTGTSFDTVSGILVKFNAQLKEAGDPSSAAARALKAIGLEAEELRRLDPAEALRKTAQAMSGFAADGDKARLIQELFGKSVREAAPFLKDLAEAGQLNATVTTQQAEAAERFNKSIYGLQANLSQFARTLLQDVVPALAEFFEKVNKQGFFSSLYDKIDLSFAQKFAAGQSARAAEITADLERLESVPRSERGIYNQDRIARLRTELDAVLKAASAANERVKALVNGPGFEPPKPLTTQQLLRGNAGYGELPGVSLPAPAPKGGGGRNAGTRSGGRMDALGTFIEDLEERKRMEDRLDAEYAREAARREAELQRHADQAQRFQDHLLLQTQDLNASLIKDDRARGEAQIEIDRQALQAQLNNLQVYGKDRTRLQDALDANIAARQKQLNEQLKPEWERMVEAWGDTTQHMTQSWNDLMAGVVQYGEDAIAKFVRTGKLSVDDLADYVQQAIARMIAQEAVAKLAQLGTFLFGANPFGPAAKGKAFGTGGAEVTAFAAGGVVGSPTYFRYEGGRRNGIMGEAGPEAIMPLRRGRDGKLGVASSGGGGNTIVVNLPMGVTRAELAAYVPTLKAEIANELVVRMRRPGFAGA